MRNDVSVIIPAYNVEDYIAEAIDSVLDQSFHAYEIIVINDGSTDNTASFLSKFEKKITVIHQDNAGASAAKNRGAKEASGNILAFLDADDMWMPKKLQAQIEKLEHFDVVYSNRLNIGVIGDLPEIQSDVQDMFEGDVWEHLIMANFITLSSVIVKKILFDKIGCFNEKIRYCEDWDFLLRCLENNQIGYCSDPLVKYRFRAGSLSKNHLYMQKMRELVITRALQSQRGQCLSAQKRRNALASSWSCSAWESARVKDYIRAFQCYGRALSITPLNGSLWYDVARVLAGRV